MKIQSNDQENKWDCQIAKRKQYYSLLSQPQCCILEMNIIHHLKG
jgi:hypothetical protein